MFGCKEAGFIRCGVDGRCIPEERRCDGVADCEDMTDESDCCDVSSTVSKSNTVTQRYPKTSTTRRRHVHRKTTKSAYLDYDYDWLNSPRRTIPSFEIPTFPTIDTDWFDDTKYRGTMPTFHERTEHGLSSAGITGIAVAGFIVFGLLLAIIRACAQRKFSRMQTRRLSISTQSLIRPEQIITDGSRVSSPLAARRDVVLRSSGGERTQGQLRGSRTVLIRTRSTSDVRSGGGEHGGGSAASRQQQQQQQKRGERNEAAQRTTDALHLMVRDGPWLTTRTLRPMIPDQPNIPLFIEESNVRRLDDRSGLVVSTPPQLMMYVDGEFVWIPASRVPDALNFIALLGLQTEEGPSPAAPEHIEDLPTVSIQQETVDTGGRCNVCLEDFNIDEQVRELPCHHLYHSDCIVPWLQLNGTCPACREPISSAQQSDNTAGARSADDETQ